MARGRWVAFPGLQRVAAVAEPPLATVHPRLFVDRSQRLKKAVLANAEATAQAEQLTEALAAERENVRALGDRVERLEQIATQEHARAEASQQEAQRHRWTVEQVQAELAQARVEKEALRVELVRAHFLSEPRNMFEELGDAPAPFGGEGDEIVEMAGAVAEAESGELVSEWSHRGASSGAAGGGVSRVS